MKYLSLAALAVLIVFSFGSCTKKDGTDPTKKECGDERSAGMTINSASQWEAYPMSGGSAKYDVFYTVLEETDQAGFGLDIEYNGVCPYGGTDVGMTFTTLIDDKDVEVVVVAQEPGADLDGVSFPVTKSGTLYNTYAPYVYPKNKDVNPTNFKAIAQVRFPTKGSWSADSTYFFGALLNSFGMSVHAKIPK